MALVTDSFTNQATGMKAAGLLRRYAPRNDSVKNHPRHNAFSQRRFQKLYRKGL
jgi:hypothetical protein